MPSIFGLDGQLPTQESVSILVGPNGSGKSSFLLDLAVRYRNERNVAIVCNTPHDRYSGLRGTQRISVGKTEGSPKTIVKRSVAKSLSGSGTQFYEISSILKYCGYHSRFGFRIKPSRQFDHALDEFSRQLHETTSISSGAADSIENDAELAFAFLQRHPLSEFIWIDAYEKALEFSRAREFASVLNLESKLRALGVFRNIEVFLQRSDDDEIIEMHHASSGQLALISSLLFLITSTGENPLVIVDEPENSLHPNWQREYISNVLTALNYRNATVVVATHAPLVVTGALTDRTSNVKVYETRNGRPRRLHIDSTLDSPSSIEEILWRAFEVVTPANHYVSEQLVKEISLYEKGEISRESVLTLIERMRDESFEPRQLEFFSAVSELLNQIDPSRS